MLIPITYLVSWWKISPTGVVHVGAHQAEEAEAYARHSFGPILWIEANPILANSLIEHVQPPSSVRQALVWSESGTSKIFKVANNGQSSSAFEFGTHQLDYPDIAVIKEIGLVTETLEEILPTKHNYDFLSLDIQGAEFEALTGLGARIGDFKFIYTEVNRVDLYKGIKRIGEIDKLLGSSRFERVGVAWSNSGWGDALYLNRAWAHQRYGGIWQFKFRKFAFSCFLFIRGLYHLSFIRPSWVRRLLASLNPSKAR
jgi:FkbM family methyltransferase